ncbi:uncharacterized protein CXQ87_001004 [Candidozyma duobushaemuli]|uniref:Zn(2)-C6 fungal-type domain-containing protein n=2 Tax=Candidozyma TaxID=3303203 RepID=A0ABX8I637_9ASCO|nr:uncharacterized protein CXQ87_001004 [[Candida] duobushaemulonis]PVH18087.1 hypothetical protein CXQ87_001004 [[Candida] duobushaemulonis]QWU86653.1 hypothetical protein CA3LBN_000871 [[Candida] haemuloni]
MAEHERDMSNHSSPAGGTGSSSGSKRVRRTKACKQCHALKVRCTPLDESDPHSPCVRCSNAGKVCEIDVDQPRKRRRRAAGSESVADLHEQIAELKEQLRQSNAQLQAKNQSSPGVNSTPRVPGITETPSDTGSPFFVSKADLEREISLLTEGGSNLSDITSVIKERSAYRKAHIEKTRVKDVVTAGIITMEEASKRLHIYKTEVFRRHPLVDVPQDKSTEQLIEEMPFLFNTVVSIASLVMNKDSNTDICSQVEIFAIEAVCTEIMVWGSKSVELVKSLILLSLWYNSPEFFKQRRYHILNTVSVSLLHDLGIVSRPSYTYSTENKTIVKQQEQHTAIEYRALIMILYISTVSICLILRRNIYVKWTPYVNECCLCLEKEDSDRFRSLATFSRLNHELERIHHIVHAPDSVENKSAVSKYVIKEFQGILSSLKGRIHPANYLQKAYYHSIEAYLHQPDFNEVQLVNTDGTGCASKLDATTLKAISQCTVSCLCALDEVAKLEPSDVAALPLVYSSRIVYTAGMLMRMRYLILSLPSHIEKDLVPRYAIQSIQKLKNLIFETSQSYPANNFLLKMRLILQLFIQTYVTQVSDLLKSHSETPNQFKPVSKDISRSERKQMALLATDMFSTGGGIMTTESGRYNAPAMHLDLLSYAASFRRMSEDAGKGEPLKKENNGVNNGTHPVQLPENVDMSAANQYPPQNFANRPMPMDPGMMTGSSANTGNTPQYNTPMPNYMPQGQYRYQDRGSQVPSVFDNNSMMQPNPSMSTQDDSMQFQGTDGQELDKMLGKESVNSINEEFWSYLLSADSNKLHFAQDMPGPNDEVFFMN